MMLKYGLDLVECFKVFQYSPFPIKVSDHLIKELLLISDARKGMSALRQLPYKPKEISLSYLLCDEYQDMLEKHFEEKLKNGSFKELVPFATHDNSSVLLRRSIFNISNDMVDREKGLAMEKEEHLRYLSTLLDEFRSTLPVDCFAAFQSAFGAGKDFDKISKDMAMLLNRSIVDGARSFETVLEHIKCVTNFFQIRQMFCDTFQVITRQRLLKDLSNHSDADFKKERAVVASFPQVKSFQRFMEAMLYDLEVNREKKSSITILNQNIWSDEIGEVTDCFLPEELARIYEQMKNNTEGDEGKNMKLVAHLGEVEMTYHFGENESCSIAMPTDFFIVLNCFNNQENLRQQDILHITGIPEKRLNSILKKLIKPPKRCKTPILLHSGESFTVNQDFKSPLKKIRF